MFYFVYNARLKTEKLINERKIRSTNKIHHAWKNYKIDQEHLRLKKQGIDLINTPGSYFFDGSNIVKINPLPVGSVGNLFDLSETNQYLMYQMIYYKPEHNCCL